MKRRYKRGDWLRIPLGCEHDAISLITAACRSRLFGYFFAIPATFAPTHADLRPLRPSGAITALLFGGAAIEAAQWPIISTSLRFDPQAWPFPDFASRGAFGETWTQVRYDPLTLQIVQRSAIDAKVASGMADARFSGTAEVEAILRGRIAGLTPPAAQSICEIRSPLDQQCLRMVERGGRIQFSTPLNASDLHRLAAFIRAHPNVALRVHGFPHGFDAALLAQMTAVRDLTLDAAALEHPQALGTLRALATLRIGALQARLEFLDSLPALDTLELRSTRAPLEPLKRLRRMRNLVLDGTEPFDFSAFTGAGSLQTLTLAHGEYDLETLNACAELRALRLHALDVTQLPHLHELHHLQKLELDALTRVIDLAPIARSGSLREVSIRHMPQLHVCDFAALHRRAELRISELDIGSRSKQREVYRARKTWEYLGT